jgi:hypothetical protein
VQLEEADDSPAPVTDVAGNYADANENARFPSRMEDAEGYFLSRAVMECGSPTITSVILSKAR